MKVKYLTSAAGDRFTREYGQVYDMDDDEAASVIAAGHGEPADGEAPKPKPGRRPRADKPPAGAGGDKLPDLESGDDV